MKKSLCFILFACCTLLYAANIKLSAIDDGNCIITDTGYSSTATYVTDDNLHVSVMATDADDDVIKLAVQITNAGENNFYFNENSILAYQGIYEENSWSNITYYPASKYYSAKEYEYGAAVTMAAVGCGILLIDTILANDCDNDHEPPRPRPQAHSNKRPERPGKGVRPSRPEYKPIPRHHYSHHHSYSYRNPSVEIVYDFSSLFAISAETSSDLKYLRTNLLFSKSIKPGETVKGVFFINRNLGPDYKISFPIGSDDMVNFYFTRSDKQSILHPWKDNKESHHAFTFTLGLPYPDRYGFNYMYCGVPVGIYTGLNFQPGWIQDEAVSFYGGLNVKTIPHTWLMLGCEADFEYSSTELDKVHIACTPQAGINCVFNVIDFGFLFGYTLNKGAKFDLMLGFAF